MASTTRTRESRAVEHSEDRAQEAQARLLRRKGETIVLRNERGEDRSWKIEEIVSGAEYAPVILSSGSETETVPALEVEECEARASGPAIGDTSVVRVENLPSAPEVPPQTRAKFRGRYGAVDVSEAVEDRARDAAEEALHREQEELRGASGFLARIFKHNLGYEIARQIGINRSRQRILSEGNLYANEGSTRREHEQAVGAVVDRFIQEHDEFLHTEGEKGERRKVFGDSGEEVRVKQELNDLVREFAAHPEMTEEELNARRDSILGEARRLAGDAKGRGVMYADNLKEIAEAVREAARHAGGIDNLDLDLEFVIGKAKIGARTEHERNIVDTLLEKMERWGKDHNAVGVVVGTLRNELAVAVASTLAIGNLVTRSVLSSNAGKVATFGGSVLVTGIYSFFREKKKLNRERSLHEREMALGGTTRNEMSQEELDRMAHERASLQAAYASLRPMRDVVRRWQIKRQLDALYEAPQPRREEMRGFELARMDAKTFIDSGRGLFGPDGHIRPDINVPIAMQMLAEMEARVRVSNTENVDLLRYSSAVEAEVERRDLDKIRMELKVALRDVNPNFDAEYGETYRQVADGLYENEDRTSGIRVTQEKFNSWANRRARNRAMTTVVIGAGIGFVGHELWALATDNETVTGSLSRAATWLKEYVTGDHHAAAVGAPIVEHIGGGVMTTPDGTHFVPQADGTFTLESYADNKTLASGLHIDNNGILDAASKAKLENIGATLVETDHVISHSEVVTERATTWDWLHEHEPDVTRIHRDVWMGNDTLMHFSPELKRWLGADFNELRLDWGKVAGVNSDGDFVMDMSRMTAGGSWNAADSENAPAELLAGKIRLILSMNEVSQNHAVEIMVNEHGQAIIPANSDIAKTFFTVKDGHAVFMGRYAEIGVLRSVDTEGTDHFAILATHLGKGIKEGVVTKTVGESVTEHVTQIALPPSYDFPPIVLPPIIPIRGRKPLERLAPKQRRGPISGYNLPAVPAYERSIFTYYNGSSLNEIQQEFRNRGIESDPYTLITNTEGKKVWVDKDGKEVHRDIERERERIQKYIEAQDSAYLEELERFNETLEPMHQECRVAVIIPARLEEKSLGNLLDQYVHQINEDEGELNKDLFEINIIVNRRDTENPDRSMQVIEEWKQRNPGFHVNAIDIAFPRSKANVGMARKYITDLSLLRTLRRTNATSSFYIESEDADLFSVDKRTITKIINGFDSKPQVDVLRGIQDRQPEVMSQNDLFFFERRLWDIGEMALRNPKLRPDVFKNGSYTWNRVISGGWNTAYTAEAYAQIGGYVSDTIGEDMKIGQKISVLRGKQDESGEFRINTQTAETSGIRSNSSPRRFLDAMVKQENAYDNFEDQSLKEKTLEDLMKGLKAFERILPEHLPRYEGALNTFYEFIRSQMNQVPEATEVMRKTLFYLGLKEGEDKDYIFNSDQRIVLQARALTTISRLLEKYRKEKRWKKGYKRQNSPLSV